MASICCKSELSEGARVRSLILADGGNVVERLEAFNQQERTYSYSIIKAPFPIVDYLSTITVLETDKPNVSACRMERAIYTCKCK